MVANNVGLLRRRRSIAAARLAEMVGVTRQSVYAIEAGSFVPNTEVALKLARALDCRVEDLFELETAAAPAPPNIQKAALLPGTGPLKPGEPVQLCRVGHRLVASVPPALSWCFPHGDAIVARRAGSPGSISICVTDPDEDFSRRVLIAGCDPGISVLARSAQLAGVELLHVHRNSSQSLRLLKDAWIHIAGTHLRDDATGSSNTAAIRALFAKGSVAAFAYATWDEGLVIAAGNSKGIQGVDDLARRDVTIVNREAGSGSRKLLDAQLKQAGIRPGAVSGYRNLADGHLAAAAKVRSGAADCCIAPRPVALSLGLSFIPLVSERYDLVLRHRDLEHPGFQVVLDTLHRVSFRRELESLGYDAANAGQRVL
jgi:putative molybdopterin biosynthesis protein